MKKRKKLINATVTENDEYFLGPIVTYKNQNNEIVIYN